MNKKMKTFCAVTLASAMSVGALAENIPLLHIADYSGPTSDIGLPYGMGVSDAMKWVNANGGINGKLIEFETTDYGYKAPQAIALYKKAMSRNQLVALQGWGTADTEALVGFVAKDKVFTMSASFSAHLTDPKGLSPRTKKPAPYNFFYGPSYSDGCRGLVDFAAADWKKSGKSGTPIFVHMGANHPYPNAPKEACAAYAEELGFSVANPIVYSMAPGDFKAQCLTLKDSKANYAYLGNTAGSNISVVKSCGTVGVDTQFLANVWGWGINAIKTTGAGGDGVAFVNSTASWNDDVPGMDLVRSVSKMSQENDDYRPVHYIRGICAAMNMIDGMKVADSKGELTGESLKDALESFKNHVPTDMEGVCLPSTWTAEDHRGMTDVLVYQTAWNNGNPSMSEVHEANLPRRADWLGW